MPCDRVNVVLEQPVALPDHDLGFGRIIASETEALNMLANQV